MASGMTKNHDYHLVDPSPWPFIGALAAFIMAVGMVLTMKAVPVAGMKIGPLVLGVGIIGVLYTMFAWWVDVTREAEHQGHHTRVVQIHHRYGMIMFIASEVMFFVAWFWAYFDVALFANEAIQYQRQEFTGGTWPPKGIETFDPWHLPLLNTLILLTSGTTVTWAHHALLHDDRKGLKQALWLTVILGVLFTICQVYEYSHAAFSFSGHVYGSTFYMATGFHGAHVVIGTIFLAVCLYRTYLNHFTPKQHLGFEFAAWYWHFVDVVWLFLFAAIYWWGAGAHAGAH
ncbi:MAG: cytochrome c oxidase subunit 3 [Hyphomicrobiales bacterium]|nr:cytochrome c oxidase subunit 3 [Hyphomicrobiales bacterium]